MNGIDGEKNKDYNSNISSVVHTHAMFYDPKWKIRTKKEISYLIEASVENVPLQIPLVKTLEI